MYLIQQTITSIVKHLTYIFNISFKTGKFPSIMKLTKIIPVFKKGEKIMYLTVAANVKNIFEEINKFSCQLIIQFVIRNIGLELNRQHLSRLISGRPSTR